MHQDDVKKKNDHGAGLIGQTIPESAETEVSPTGYVWRVGDVFTDGKYRWHVDSIQGDRATLQSCGTSWAWTRPLTFNEWSEGGYWKLEEVQHTCHGNEHMPPVPCAACEMEELTRLKESR